MLKIDVHVQENALSASKKPASGREEVDAVVIVKWFWIGIKPLDGVKHRTDDRI